MTTVRTVLLVIVASCAGCGRNPPATAPAVPVPSGAMTNPAATTAGVVQTQTVPSGPCAWLSQSDVEKIVGGALLRAPLRVRSVDDARPTEEGEACLYELPATGSVKNTAVIRLIPDESGAMQAAFTGMGSLESEFKGTPTDANPGPGGRLDYVAAMPGGVTALRQGRIAAQMTTSGSMSDQGLALVTAMLDRLPDLPFVLSPEDAAVAPGGPDPCRLITPAEAEAVLGHLVVAPYRSRKATALVFGSGASCSYFSGRHRALVVTPKESHGAQLFGMLAGVDAKMARTLETSQATSAPTGDWDQMTIGPDGTLHVLKGDKMLSVQFSTSSADRDAAAKLVRVALSRL